VKSGVHVLKVAEASIGYGERVLAKGVNLEIKRGQKVAIIGANGIGKSTLLNETPEIYGRPMLPMDVSETVMSKHDNVGRGVVSDLSRWPSVLLAS
jgi:ATPase subunit of ABC transporter with duplicated ATPase domains